MKTTAFAFAALLGLGLSTTAFAQTVPMTPGTATTPVTTGTVAPGQVGTTSGAVPNSTMNGTMTTSGTMTTPAGAVPMGTAPAGATPGGVYSPGATTAPNGALDATRPVGASPVTPGATRRTTTGSRTNTTRTVRP